MKVNEIFYSLQGEGNFAGTPSIFIRLSGCNLACDFCDTTHNHGKEMTEAEIIEEVTRYPAMHVVITGGEPTLQLTDSLVDALHRERRFVQIETNGTRKLNGKLAESIDWITVSPKYGNVPNIQRIDELKVVFDMEHLEHLDKLTDVEAGYRQCYYLQPCDRLNEQWNSLNLQNCINYIMLHPKWKLSLQTHKMLGLR